MQNSKKTSKALLVGVVAAVVLLIALLALLLTFCGLGGIGSGASKPTETTEAVETVPTYTLYWNMDRAQYAGKSEAGMSSRTMEDDGYFHIRFIVDGKEMVLKTADRKLVNLIDTMDLMGLELDEDGLIADAFDLDDMPLELVGYKFYVQSIGGKVIKLNSADSFIGMEVLLEATDRTAILDMTGVSGPVGCVAEPTVGDRVIAIQNLAGELTHLFLADRSNFMLTHRAQCEHCKEEVEWSEWVKTEAFPSKSGHYQLQTDIQLKGQQSLASDVKICLDLNGHTITGKDNTRLISLHNPGTSFALMDTSEEQTGKLVGHSESSPQGGIVWVRYGQFHMYAGTLDGSDMVSRLNGTVVQVPKNAFFYMYGGTILGGTAAPQYDETTGKYTYGLGGAVQVTGTMRMYGGTIRGGKAPAAYYYNNGKLAIARGMGGNIFLASGSVMEIAGGEILYGYAGNVGGNIMMDGTAELIISGGTISGGWTDAKVANKHGGSIYVGGKASITMTGGVIEGGHNKTAAGGNIYLAGKMTMSGGTIRAGRAYTSGGNIHMGSTSKLIMYAGTIRDGVADSNAGNINVSSKSTMTMYGGFIRNGIAGLSGGNIACNTSGVLNLAGGLVTGGTANGTAAGYGGGNIALVADKTVVNITGGTVSDGVSVGVVNEDGTTLGGDGGNINLNRGTLHVTGGTITGGTATGNSGGIYIGWNSAGMTLSGKAQIYGNEKMDICRSSNTSTTKSLMTLGAWEGNGENGQLVIERLGAGAGSVLAQRAENVTLGAEDAAKFVSTRLVLPVAISAKGDLILSETAVLGEADHTHCLCNGQLVGHSCADTGFVSVTAAQFAECWVKGDTSSLLGSLNMCLTEDVTLDHEYAMSGGVLNLCLHGHTVTMTGNARLTANGTSGVLNITDCTGSGKIVAAEGCNTSILYTYKGKLNIYAGTVDASLCAAGAGGAIRVAQPGDELNIYGGNVIGSKQSTIGGAIYVTGSATVNIYGGAVKDGVASNYGGNIGMTNGTLNIFGGTVSGGSGASGGNIQSTNDNVVINISGGTIRDGVATKTGTGAGLGGNIHVVRGTLNISGGTVTGGTAKGATDANTPVGTTGGIYVAYNAKAFTLSGDAKIYGNKVADIWLTSKASYVLTLDGWKGNGGNELVIGKTGGAAGSLLVAAKTDALTKADLEHFTSGHNGLDLKLADGKIVLAAPFVHDHCICAGKADGHSCTTVRFVEVEDKYDFDQLFTDGVLNGSVSIALTGDITLTSEYKVGGNTLDLCLNGHTVTMSGTGRLTANGGGTVNITDCGDGRIVAAEGAQQSFLYTYGGKLNLYAGIIDAGAIVQSTASTGGKNGGAVTVNSTGDSFHMYGGEILGATLYRGGAVYVYEGDFHMHGGRISGGKANVGGNVATNYGSFTMDGGVITGGTAEVNGAGVFLGYNSKTTLTLSGNAMIYGNTGAEDVYAGQKTASLNKLILDGWQGNGEHAALVLATRSGADGAVVATAGEGQLTAADVSKLDSGHEGLKLALNADGAIILQEIVYHQHCVCDGALAGKDGHTCTDVIYTEIATTEDFLALFNENKELKADATVVLMGDIALSAEYKLAGKTLNLCLNDKTITMSGSGRITANGNGGTLQLSACEGGKIVAAEGTTPGLLYTYKGHIHVYSGTVDASKCGSGSGGAVTLGSTGDTVNIYGGTFLGNRNSLNGGNIYAAANADGVVNIYGGMIRDGKAVKNKATGNGLGGNIHMTAGTLNLFGGTVTGGSADGKANDADTAGLSGGIYIPYNGTMTLSGNAKVYGNTGSDIYLTSRTDKAVLTVDNWAGNGDEGALKLAKLSAVDGTQLVGPTVTAADAAKFASVIEGTALVLDATGGISLKQLHYHCVCNGKVTDDKLHTCEKLVFTEVNATQFLALFGEEKKLTASHNVVLTENVTLDAEYALGGNTLNLCLGGSTITMTSNGRFSVNGTTGVLNLTACGDGKIVAAEGCRYGILYTYKGTLNIYGGTVDASGCAAGDGGAIRVGAAGDVVNIYGGKIIGSQKATHGGTIYCKVVATTTIYGGEITGGQAQNGGNIALDGGAVLYLKGGKVTNGITTGTSAGQGGGNIRVTGAASIFYMEGGEVSGGQANGTVGNDGGNININNGKAFLSGGTVTGGTATGNGGGIYVGYNPAGVTVSGSALIYGNTGTDIVRSSNTSTTKGLLLLGDWAGNGEHGAAKLDTLLTATGKTVISAASGYTLTEADLAKFECVGTYKMILSGGKFVTAAK